MFFANTYMPGISHVDIYLGGGLQINAPTEGEVVSVAPVCSAYWARTALARDGATMRFAQADGGITINFPTVDWSQLVPQLVGLFFDAIGTCLQKGLHSVVDGVWGNGANVVGQTPLEMTWSFGPVAAQIGDIQSAARARVLATSARKDPARM